MFYQNTPNTARTSVSCGRTPVNGRGNSGCMPVSPCMPDSDMDYACGAREGYIDQYPVAMAYVPWQRFGEIFPLDRGYHIGTIFQNLDFPFMCASQACTSCNSSRNMRGGRL